MTETIVLTQQELGRREIHMKIKGAIFDMDGTLIDSLGVWNILWSKIGQEYLNDKEFKPIEKDDKLVRTMLLKDAIYMICEKYNVSASPEKVIEFTNNVMIDFYKNDVCLKEGVVEFLDYLSEKGVKMCIASATEKSLVELAVEHCGINKYFPKIISCADVGRGKDSPEVFIAALNYLRTSLEETWVFEDSLVAIKTASNSGFNTVGIYDCNNYGQDEISTIATVYIAMDENILKLIK